MSRDANVADAAQASRIDVVGELPGLAVIVADTYPSKPAGMSMCQAGEERFLRVISVTEPAPKETYAVKLESCRDNLELAESGLEWRADTATLRIGWLLGPSKTGKPEMQEITIGKDGIPRTLEP